MSKIELEFDRQAMIVLVAIAERIARKRKAEKLAKRGNLRAVEGKKAA
jgi:hypothetical protein